jgi:hypothetical protein
MNILKTYCLIFLVANAIWSCDGKRKVNAELPIVESACCEAEPPPPPPPVQFQLIKTEQLGFKYGDGFAHFKVSLFTDRLYKLREKYLQTFAVYAQTDRNADSFYFALPTEMNRYWQDITIVKTDAKFDLGFYTDSNRFRTLYRVYLGDAKLNKDRIFMSSVDTVE